MVSKRRLSIFTWALYFVYVGYGIVAGSLEWPAVLVGLGFASLVFGWAFGFEYLEKRFDVGEARFDSKTGKLIKDHREP